MSGVNLLTAPVPRYRCHKEVGALKIKTIHMKMDGTGDADITFENFPDSINVEARWLGKHEPKVGGYFVVYADGYTSFSPADAFETGYTPIDGPAGATGPVGTPGQQTEFRHRQLVEDQETGTRWRVWSAPMVHDRGVDVMVWNDYGTVKAFPAARLRAL